MARIDFYEAGTTGIKEYTGFVQEAYNTQLYWPSVQPLYSRMRRSDPEISIVRNIFTSLARSVAFHWELPDKPSAGDKQAGEFADTLFDDV